MIMEDNYDISKLKKKKKVNSRTKGASFERQIATMLNKRFNTKEFSRTPGSGAFATTHNLPEHLKLHGDLITPKNFRYCIECKKGYNKENLYSLDNYRSDFWIPFYLNISGTLGVRCLLVDYSVFRTWLVPHVCYICMLHFDSLDLQFTRGLC